MACRGEIQEETSSLPGLRRQSWESREPKGSIVCKAEYEKMRDAQRENSERHKSLATY